MKAVDWIELAHYNFRRMHPVVVCHIKNRYTCCRQPQQNFSLLSVHAACYGRTGRRQAFKYMIFTTHYKMNIYIYIYIYLSAYAFYFEF